MTAIRVIGQPPSWLSEYAKIPIVFETRERMRVNGHPGSWTLEPEVLDAIVEKDYDVFDTERPAAWSRFDLSHWQLFAAFEGDAVLGAAAVAMRTPELNLLEGRDDVALLFDIRILTGHRHRGIGSTLLRAAEQWAAARGARRMIIETQDTNPDACRFYARREYHLSAVNPGAYPELPHETQLIWSKSLRPPRRIVGFHQDDEQHWVADLECGHTQHVRHDPPWQSRPWVTNEEGRKRFMGTMLPCRDCERDETF